MRCSICGKEYVRWYGRRLNGWRCPNHPQTSWTIDVYPKDKETQKMRRRIMKIKNIKNQEDLNDDEWGKLEEEYRNGRY